jgi:hypothetical protein
VAWQTTFTLLIAVALGVPLGAADLPRRGREWTPTRAEDDHA